MGFAALLLAACGGDGGGDDGALPCESAWSQWGGDGTHGGRACAEGQDLRGVLGRFTFDPFVLQELADADGVLVIHYQAPLVDGDDVYMMFKGGVYTSGVDPYRLNTQEWGEKAFRWVGGELVEQWSFVSDWKPVPGLRFEPMFQPALIDDDTIALPAAGGSLRLIDRATGQQVQHVTPFGPGIDADTYVTGGVAVGGDGALYYNAIRLDHDRLWLADAESWLVRVAPDRTVRTVPYATSVPLPADALCYGRFDPLITPRPWPPPPAKDGSPTLPAQTPCGAQRPGINVTPAIGADGTVFAVTRAHFSEQYVYVTAFRPDLGVAWSTSLRDRLADGCGVTDLTCRDGATLGVDPATNLPPAGQVIDIASSSPVALPDGGVLFGTSSTYNDGRGHLFKLDAAGAPVATYDFGWDLTPAVVATATSYEIVIKDNYYREDEWVDLGPYQITRLDASLRPIWKFLNTEHWSCLRQDNGDVTCVDDHPNGFEWCVNALAVDARGVTYANAEDGYLYAIEPDGTLRDRLFLDRALGAAYTPVTLDQRGRIYALNNGEMTALGEP